MIDIFETSWSRCWKCIGATGSGESFKRQIIDAYGEPHRKYHTLQHLKECLTLFSQNIQQAKHTGEVEIALWFHDVIYSTRSSDNEAKSADLAIEVLTSANVNPKSIQRVKALILSTEHTASPNLPDQQLLVDIDLSILGASAERFSEYEKQVSQEYKFVPGFIFRRKRKQVLQTFLGRDFIYSTNDFRKIFEQQARRNISESIASLSL